jgi:hypothetical protein
MAYEMPRTVLPVWRLTVHIVLGAFAFLVVFMVAIGVGWWVDWMESRGAHKWVIEYARWGETAILWLDLLGLALFLLKEFIKFGRHVLLKDWED